MNQRGRKTVGPVVWRLSAVFPAATVTLAALLLSAPPAAASPRVTAPRALGWSVGLSGATAVASALGTAKKPGTVLVEVRSGASWHHQATLSDPYPVQGRSFGSSIALADTSRSGAGTLLIGDPGYGLGTGIVYVYVRAHGTWHRQARLTDPGGTSGDSFGSRVALAGNVALIGADGTGDFAGAAYIYVRSGTSWHLQARIADPRHTADDNFGQAVALSGTTVAVANGATSGPAVYVFARARTTWRRQAALTLGPTNVIVADLALSGSILVAGAPGDNDTVGGRALVFARSGTAWRRQAKLADPRHPADEFFGRAVAISPTASGVRLLVGNPDAGANQCGKSYDYGRSGSAWRLKAVIVNPSCKQDAAFAASAAFGTAIALQGHGAIIGAPFTRNGIGAWYYLRIP